MRKLLLAGVLRWQQQALGRPHGVTWLARVQVNFPVSHCLLALPGVKKEDLKRVLSHPQALAQTEGYLSQLGVIREAAEDTAGSAQVSQAAHRLRRCSRGRHAYHRTALVVDVKHPECGSFLSAAEAAHRQEGAGRQVPRGALEGETIACRLQAVPLPPVPAYACLLRPASARQEWRLRAESGGAGGDADTYGMPTSLASVCCSSLLRRGGRMLGR
jgi:hypothetical protein